MRVPHVTFFYPPPRLPTLMMGRLLIEIGLQAEQGMCKWRGDKERGVMTFKDSIDNSCPASAII